MTEIEKKKRLQHLIDVLQQRDPKTPGLANRINRVKTDLARLIAEETPKPIPKDIPKMESKPESKDSPKEISKVEIKKKKKISVLKEEFVEVDE